MSAYINPGSSRTVDDVLKNLMRAGRTADTDVEMHSFMEHGLNSVSRRIESPSVEYLYTVLGQLGNVKVGDNGERLTDDIWGCTIHDESAYLENDNLFSESMNTLQLLRESQRTLTLLLASLSRTLTSLRRATKAATLSHGITALPDELLAHVFKLLVPYPSETHSPNISALLAVSRRFRALTLATPRLWSVLPVPRADAAGRWSMLRTLELSRNVGLSVELPLLITEDNRPNPEWDAQLAVLMAHAHRWRSLSVDFAAVEELVEEDGEEWLATLGFPPAVLDSVESIFVGDSPHRYGWATYGSDYDDASGDFYAAWSFPRCTRLVAEMHIPPPGVLSTLTEFSLDLSIHMPPDDSDDDDSPLTLDALVAFLNTTPHLQHFKLTTGEYSYAPPRTTAHLPSLTSLRFENRYPHPEALRLMRTVAHALSTPHLASAEFFLCVAREAELAGAGGAGTDDDDPGDAGWAWLEAFFPAERSYPSLRRLDLEFRVSRSVTACVGALAARFPALEELELAQASAHSLGEEGAGVYREKAPGLKRIRFCDVHLRSKKAVREYTFGENGKGGEGLSVRSYFE